MSVATAASPPSSTMCPPPPPIPPTATTPAVATATAVAANDPLLADPSTNPEDTFAQYLRTMHSSRAPPPKAISPRIYGRSPRLPSALPLSASPQVPASAIPLSASPQVLDHIAPDRLLLPTDNDAMLDISCSTASASAAASAINAMNNNDVASERERQERQQRVDSFRARPRAPPGMPRSVDEVDEADADKFFKSIPRTGLSPLPSMTLPKFHLPILVPPTTHSNNNSNNNISDDDDSNNNTPNNSSSSTTTGTTTNSSLTNNPSSNKNFNNNNDSNNCATAMPIDTNPTTSNNFPPPNNANITTLPSPPPLLAAEEATNNSAAAGNGTDMHRETNNSNNSNPFSMENHPFRLQSTDPLPWTNNPFSRSPATGGSNLNRLSSRELGMNMMNTNEGGNTPKDEVKLELSEYPSWSTQSLPTQMDRLEIVNNGLPRRPQPAISLVLEPSLRDGDGNIANSINSNEFGIQLQQQQQHQPMVISSGNNTSSKVRRASNGVTANPGPGRRKRSAWHDSAVTKPARKPPTQPGGDVEAPSCNICGTKFARRSNLYKHLRSVHEEERKFSCDLCSMKFKRQDHLIKHKRSVHAKERKFSCDICGIGFAEKFNRDKHRRNIHNNKRPFRCGCGAYFQDRDKMLNCLQCKRQQQQQEQNQMATNQMAAF